MAHTTRGYKKEMNYRGLEIRYSERSNMTAAFNNVTLEMVASCEGATGEIFALVDEYLSAKGY